MLFLHLILVSCFLNGATSYIKVDKYVRRHAFKKIQLKNNDKLEVCGYGLANEMHVSLSDRRPWWNEWSMIVIRLDFNNKKQERTIVQMNAVALPGKEINKTRESSFVSPKGTYITKDNRYCLEFNLEEPNALRIYYPMNKIKSYDAVPYDYIPFERQASLNYLFVQGAHSVYATLNGKPLQKSTGDQIEKFDHHLFYHVEGRGEKVLEHGLNICFSGIKEQQHNKIFIRLLPNHPSENQNTTILYFMNNIEMGYAYADYTMPKQLGFFTNEVSDAEGGQKQLDEPYGYENDYCVNFWVLNPEGIRTLHFEMVDSVPEPEESSRQFQIPFNEELALKYLKIDGIPLSSVIVKDGLGIINGTELGDESPEYYKDSTA